MRESNNRSALGFMVFVYAILLLFIANSCINGASNDLKRVKALEEMVDGSYPLP